jgi:hypothetical protein
MKKLNISFLFFVIFAFRPLYAVEKNSSVSSGEQVQKLVAAAWKEPIKSIDVAFYEDYTKVPEPIEQIRKRAEKIADEEFKGRSIDELKPYEIERRNKNIEINFKNWVENQKFPRKIKKQVRISSDKQRIDFVKVGPNEPLDINTPFVDTFINTKDVNTGEFVSYHYAGDMKRVFVDTTKWTKQTVIQFANMPVAGALQAFLGIDKGNTPTSLNYIPDPNKMAELAETGLAKIEYVGGKKVERQGVNRINIYPDPNSHKARDVIEIGDPNYFPAAVLMCDRQDYSRVYRTEFHMPITNQIIYVRECDNFDSNGFPHNITEIKYDKDGNFLEKSVYKIIKVELNPSISNEVFELKPPADYEVDDHRPLEKRPKNVTYLTTEVVEETLKQVDKAYREKDLATLKEFLKHESWRVRSSALGLITGVTEGEELKEIVESVRNDENNEVRKKADRILERFQR